jgi:predicted Zn-dependent peptidase
MVKREPSRFVSGISVEYVPVSQAYFSIGVQACPYAHPDRYGMHVLNNILGGGISSRLFRRIRDDLGMVYDIHSEYHAYSDDGIWVIEGCTSAEYLIEVLERTLEELSKLLLSREPVDDEELLKTKMHICGQHIIASENTSVRTARLGTQEFYFGHRIDQENILKRINEVDNQTIQNISDHTLKKGLEGISLAVVGPPELDRIDRYRLEEVVDKYRI